MMKLILSLTLIWALSSTAGALQCQNCTDVLCSSTTLVTCPSETMCVTASIRATSSGTTTQQIFKACAPSSLCPATGAQTFSANLGVSGAVASAQCCNTDDCNSVTLPFPAAQTDNSLQCYSCTTPQCTTQLQCQGVEDRCFTASVTSGSSTSPAFGCTSTNVCAAAASLGSLPFLQSLGTIASRPTCCGTSLCNALTTTAAPTTTATAPPTTTTTAAPTTTTTAAPTTTTAAPTTTTTAAPTTTTAAPTTTTTAAPTTTTTAAPTTTTTAAPTTTTTAAPTTTTAAPTTTTTAAPTTTTTAAPTTTTTAQTTTTTAAPTTTTTAAPTTITTAAPTTTTAAPTTTTAAPVTVAPTTITNAATQPATTTTTTTTSDTCCTRLATIHLLLGLLMFTLW